MALITKEELPNEPTKDTKEYLKFTSEMLQKLSIIDQDRMTKQDYHHLLALDQHPTDLISSVLNPSNNNKNNTNVSNTMHYPISGTRTEN